MRALHEHNNSCPNRATEPPQPRASPRLKGDAQEEVTSGFIAAFTVAVLNKQFT